MNHYTPMVKEQIIETVSKIFSLATFKIGGAVILGAAEYLIGVQNASSFLALIVLVTLDFATAIRAKYKTGEEIQSRKTLKSVSKLVTYGIFVSAAHLTENIIPGESYLDQVAISYLALTELISIMENLALMGYSMPKKFLNKLKKLKDSQ